MRITKEVNWFLQIGDSEERQLLYYFDRPSFRNTYSEREKPDGSTLLESGKPKWEVMRIELPTRPMPNMSKWLEDNDIRDLRAICMSLDGNLLEEWFIQGAWVLKGEYKIGHRTDMNVHSLMIRYTWARKVR